MKSKKEKIKQKIIGTLVITFMLLMITGTVKVDLVSAIGDNTILQQVVSAGTLSLESPDQVNFADVTLNTFPINSTANLTQVNMRDARGSGAGWTAVGSANHLTAPNSSIISNVYLRWSPGSIFALDGASNIGVASGPAYSGNFGDGLRTLANTDSGNGMGNYVINGTTLNLLVLPTTAAATYQNTLLITIS